MSSRVSYPVTAGMSGDYRSFDRSTRAGRLLHNLYQAPGKDSTLDRELAKKLEQQRKQREAMEMPKPKATPKSRAYVEIPQAPPKEYPKYLPPISRRPLKQIQQNEKEENAKYQKQIQKVQEQNQAQVRTDEDKFKLQHKFQFGVEPNEKLVHAFNAERTRVAGTVAEGTGITQPFAFSSASVAREKKIDRERSLWLKRFDEVNAQITEKKQLIAELDDENVNTVVTMMRNEEMDSVVAPAAGKKSASGASALSNNVHSKTANIAREKRLRLTNELRDLIREMKEVDERLKEIDETA